MDAKVIAGGKSLAATVRTLAVESLLRRGFSLVDGMPEEAFAADSGKIVRYFAPYYSIRSTGINITGKIGIFLPEFESEWGEVGSSEAEYAPFGMLIDNCRTLAHVPNFSVENLDEIPVWIDLIVDETNRLPKDIEQLKCNIGGGFIGNYPTNFFYLPNEKSDAAMKWILLQ